MDWKGCAASNAGGTFQARKKSEADGFARERVHERSPSSQSVARFFESSRRGWPAQFRPRRTRSQSYSASSNPVPLLPKRTRTGRRWCRKEITAAANDLHVRELLDATLYECLHKQARTRKGWTWHLHHSHFRETIDKKIWRRRWSPLARRFYELLKMSRSHGGGRSSRWSRESCPNVDSRSALHVVRERCGSRLHRNRTIGYVGGSANRRR